MVDTAILLFHSRSGTAFTVLVIMLVVTTISLSIAAPRLHHAVRQKKGAETRAILAEYRRAAERFLRANGRAPISLDEMLCDASGRHFLRRVYADPYTGRSEWGICQNASRAEFFSLASAAPYFPLD